MMNLCLAYKGKELLKMYSTWNKNETKEIIKLGVKFGKIVPSRNKCPTLNESSLPPKCVAPNPTFGETRVRPIPRLTLAKKDIFIISNNDDFLLTPHKNKYKHASVA